VPGVRNTQTAYVKKRSQLQSHPSEMALKPRDVPRTLRYAENPSSNPTGSPDTETTDEVIVYHADRLHVGYMTVEPTN